MNIENVNSNILKKGTLIDLTALKTEGKDLARIMEKVRIDEVSGCWIWTAKGNTSRNPQVKLKGRYVQPHRLLFKLLNPTVDLDGVSVRPTCGNPLCINPDHQEVRGYGSTGHPRAERKLTKDTVKVIKRLLAKGEMDQGEIAELFEVAPGTISNINTGSRWSSVTA